MIVDIMKSMHALESERICSQLFILHFNLWRSVAMENGQGGNQVNGGNEAAMDEQARNMRRALPSERELVRDNMKSKSFIHTRLPFVCGLCSFQCTLTHIHAWSLSGQST